MQTNKKLKKKIAAKRNQRLDYFSCSPLQFLRGLQKRRIMDDAEQVIDTRYTISWTTFHIALYIKQLTKVHCNLSFFLRCKIIVQIMNSFFFFFFCSSVPQISHTHKKRLYSRKKVLSPQIVYEKI